MTNTQTETHYTHRADKQTKTFIRLAQLCLVGPTYILWHFRKVENPDFEMTLLGVRNKHCH